MINRWLPIWVIPVVVVFSLGTVALRLNIVRITYSLDETDRMIRSLQQARDKAELKLSSLRSPRRLEILARTRFKLSPPQPSQVVHLKDVQ